jgi:hypothetical protein
MDKATLIDTIVQHAHFGTQMDLDAFVKASEDLGSEMLDADEVATLIVALGAGEEHDEVRWSILHLVEHQAFESYIVGAFEALVRDPQNDWVRTVLVRLSNAPHLWPKVEATLAQLDPARRQQMLVGLRALSKGPRNAKLIRLADGLAAP